VADLTSTSKQVSIPILAGMGGLLWMLATSYLLNSDAVPLLQISAHRIVNFTFTMQAMVLPASFVVLFVIYFYDRSAFRKFFRVGMRSGNGDHDWNIYGPLAAVGFTLGTAMMMSFQVTSQNGVINRSFIELLPLVLLLSATNAWSEEIFSRFAFVAGLDGKVQPVTICWVSGIVFGLGHIFGTPSGLFGVVASGTLGWILAKSVIETKGLGWAIFIHFLQDVMIFGAGAMVIAGQ
jgi:membrane protease YdiL (CAAX protease family)